MQKATSHSFAFDWRASYWRIRRCISIDVSYRAGTSSTVKPS